MWRLRAHTLPAATEAQDPELPACTALPQGPCSWLGAEPAWWNPLPKRWPRGGHCDWQGRSGWKLKCWLGSHRYEKQIELRTGVESWLQVPMLQIKFWKELYMQISPSRWLRRWECENGRIEHILFQMVGVIIDYTGQTCLGSLQCWAEVIGHLNPEFALHCWPCWLTGALTTALCGEENRYRIIIRLILKAFFPSSCPHVPLRGCLSAVLVIGTGLGALRRWVVLFSCLFLKAYISNWALHLIFFLPFYT